MSEESDNSNEKINWTVYSIPKFNEEFKQWEVEITQPTGEKSKQLFPTENDAKNFIKDKLPIEKEFELNDSQKKIVLDRWNDKTKPPPSIKELTELNFPGKDGRDFQGKATKKYIGELGLSKEIRTNCIPRNKSDDIILTDEQKKFLENNCPPMSAAEAARVLSGDNKLNNRNALTITVNNFLKTLNPAVRCALNVDDVPDKEYSPPKTIEQAIARINRATQGMLEKNKELLEHQKTKVALNAYIRFCHVGRFALLINNFQSKTDRYLFEETFTRYIWDKPDLSQEEVDAYINLCLDLINHTKMQREVENLTKMRDQCLDDSEGKKMSMGMVEMIGKLYQEMDANQKRQDKLREILIGKRKERLEAQIQANASVIQLVEAWRDEKQRQRMIKLAEERKKLCRDEIERLDTMESFIGEVFGLNKESFE